MSNYETMDVTNVMQTLSQLLERVAQSRARIEITRGSGEACVIISKAELESLEKALEILADTENVRAIQRTLARVAAIAGPPA